MTIAYYLTTECETCGEDMFYGLCMSVLDHYNGHPVISCGTVSQIKFTCDNCDGETYTGDFDDMCEYEEGNVPEEDEDEE